MAKRKLKGDMMQIGKTEIITVTRPETNFDKACDFAYDLAVLKFGIDEYGHSKKLIEWERSSCSIELEFDSYKRVGDHHIYIFSAIAYKNIDN